MSYRRGSIANPLSQYGDEDEDEMIDEDDYVAQVLQKQRKLADLVAPEDAFVSSLPPKVQERLFATINHDSDPESSYAHLSPPPPPPSGIHFESIFNGVVPPGMNMMSIGGTDVDNSSQVGFPLMSVDALLCGGGAMFNIEGSAKERPPPDFEPLGGALTVELGGISGFDNPLDFDISCCLIDASGEERGFPANWISKRSTHMPFWSALRFVGPPGYVCKPGDRLEFRVFRGYELLGTAQLGNLDTTRPSAVGDDPAKVLTIKCVKSTLTSSLDPLLGIKIPKTAELTMRLVNPPPVLKRVFFIRHGQSEWNRATEETYNVPNMIGVDHPLSERGISEAMSLNQAIKTAGKSSPQSTAAQMLELNEFLNAPMVISSPLTRALQTTMVALRDHPTVRRRGIVLRSEVRELKNPFGLDTISESRGGAIVKRAQDLLGSSQVFMSDSQCTASLNIDVDSRGATDRWWDLMETPDDKLQHIEEMVRMIRMLPVRSAVIVGHSLVMRGMMKQFASSSIDPQFLDRKLQNCGCMAVDFDFDYKDAGGDRAAGGSFNTKLPIRSAKLMFGSNFL